MTILKHGDENKIYKERYFKCEVCDCIFIANRTEYDEEDRYDNLIYTCKCPETDCFGKGYEIYYNDKELQEILNGE